MNFSRLKVRYSSFVVLHRQVAPPLPLSRGRLVRLKRHVFGFHAQYINFRNDLCVSSCNACRGQFDEAARAGDLALQLLDRNPDKEWRARVSGFVYGGIYCLRHPYKESLPPLLSAHRSAIVLGDIHVSAINVCSKEHCNFI